MTVSALLLSLAAAAGVIVVVSVLTTSLQVASLRYALLAAVVVTALAWITSFVVAPLELWAFGEAFEPGISTLPAGPELYLHVALLFATKTVVIFLAALLTPGVSLQGVAGLVLAASALTAVDIVLAATTLVVG